MNYFNIVFDLYKLEQTAAKSMSYFGIDSSGFKPSVIEIVGNVHPEDHEKGRICQVFCLKCVRVCVRGGLSSIARQAEK